MVVLGAGCGPAEPTWTSHTSTAETWTIDLPAEPETSTTSQNGLDFTLWTATVGDDQYIFTEVPLPPGTPFDLDAPVQGSVDGMKSSMEQQGATDSSVELVETGSEPFAGVDARRYTAVALVDGENAIRQGRAFVKDDMLYQLQALDVDDDDRENVDRFFDSLTAL